MSARPRWSRSRTIIPAHVPKIGAVERAQRLVEPVEPHQPRDRRRLAAGHDQAVEPVELLGQPHLDRLRAEAPQHRRVLAEVPLHGEDADSKRLLHATDCRGALAAVRRRRRLDESRARRAGSRRTRRRATAPSRGTRIRRTARTTRCRRRSPTRSTKCDGRGEEADRAEHRPARAPVACAIPT